MSSRPPPPDNRRSLLRLTVATAVFTVVLVYFARAPWRVVVVAVASAGFAAAGSVAITASATWFRRWRERRKLPMQEPLQEQQPLEEEQPLEQPLEEQERQEQLHQEQLRRLDEMSQQDRQELLYRLEQGSSRAQQDLERLSQKERRERLTKDEAEFRQQLLEEHDLWCGR